MPCAGNASEFCGGSLRLNLYVSNTTQTGPTAVQKIGNYVSLGCYSEAINQRALTGNATFNDSMTVEICYNWCSGYTYFGLEYGREW
jgi:hypothetical protein